MNLKNNIIYNFIFLENYAQVLKFLNIILIFDRERERERERERVLRDNLLRLSHTSFTFNSPKVLKL
jgi:hypothetical protein